LIFNLYIVKQIHSAMYKYRFLLFLLLLSATVLQAQPVIRSTSKLTLLSPGVYESYTCMTIGTTLQTDPVYTSYLWSTGGTTASIFFFTGFPQTDTVTLTVTDAGGNVSSSTIYMYGGGQFNQPMSQYGTIGQGCNGDSLLMIGGFQTGDSMIWSNGHVVLSILDCDASYPGNGCAEYFSTTGNKSYTIVSAGSGCRYFATLPFAFYPYPLTPGISQSGDTLVASTVAPRYVWMDVNGNPIAGATARKYLPAAAGTYSVKANGSPSNVNCFSQNSLAYTYLPGCYATYTWQPDTATQFSLVLLNGAMPLGVNGGSYLWDFGDGATSTLENPTHTYAGPGSYAVCVTVSAAGGCAQSFCDTVVVTNKVNTPFSIRVVRSLSVGTSTPQAAASVTCWPNPAASLLHIGFELLTGDKVSISLLDLQGRIVGSLPTQNLPAGLHRLPYTTQDLASGIYLLRVQRGESVDVLKVVLNK
jgi:hypothetical protein